MSVEAQTPRNTGHQRKGERTWFSLALPAIFALGLYCVPLPQDHVLSIHESVLPQTARTMSHNGDWLIPRRDAATPWLENPPLPQWVTVALCAAADTCSQAWVARLAAGLTGALVVLLVTLMAARLFGSGIGLLSGFTMATSYEVVRYATLAEDEIFLALTSATAMACFVKAEFPRYVKAGPDPANRQAGALQIWGRRPWPVIGFFAAAGLTNLTKGVGFGPMIVLIPVACFVILAWDGARVRRYLWVWGLLMFALIGLWWPVVVALQVPGALELWTYDLFGRLSGGYALMNKPFWYYGVALLQVTAPWVFVIPVAGAITWRSALFNRNSPERFVWVWALSVPLVLSLFSGKHHHYLLHSVAPWAMLAALGLRTVGRKLVAPERFHRPATVVLFGLLAILYSAFLSTHKTVHYEDGVFLRKVTKTFPSGPFLVDQSITDGLKAFQISFYLPYSHTRGLHNLSFLKSDEITEDSVYVITEYSRRDELARYGDAKQLMQSDKTGRHQDAGSLLTLFRLTYDEHLKRVTTNDLRITPMQGMYRSAGPVLE
jgi:4-amino-4-deoxy-L-arabinose transferase-like glycosyltransferase